MNSVSEATSSCCSAPQAFLAGNLSTNFVLDSYPYGFTDNRLTEAEMVRSPLRVNRDAWSTPPLSLPPEHKNLAVGSVTVSASLTISG